MPWTASQHRLFQAAAHNAAIAREHGMSQSKAREMASEGVKRAPSAKAMRLAKGLRSR